VGTGIDVRGQDGATRIGVGERFEALHDCAGTPVLLSAREVEPNTLNLVKSIPPDEAPTPTVAAAPRPELTPVSTLTTLRFVAATDPKSSGVRTSPPLLTDGDPSTTLTARTDRTPQFIRAHLAASGFPVRRIEFGAPAGRASLPSQVIVQLGNAPALTVTLDPNAPVQTLAFEKPVDASCVSVTIPGPVPPGARWALGELRVVTALDEGDAAPLLAESLVQGGAGAAEAPRLLKQLGAAGAKATLSIWPRLDTLARQRALPVLSRYLA
jgi:hypothetical protein